MRRGQRARFEKILKDLGSLEQSLALMIREEKPSDLMRRAGLEPDVWQEDLLDGDWRKALLLIHRQGGKSTTTAALALHVAINQPGATVLITAPARFQASLLFSKIKHFYEAIGRPFETENDSMTLLKFSNGSIIHALHGSEKTLRGISAVDFLIVDEASRVHDALFAAVSPMLAISGGRQILLSTPWGKRGYFYEQWVSSNDWKRVKITAGQCPRITQQFLQEERASMPANAYLQEYFCEFTDAIDAVFLEKDVEKIGDYSIEAWDD